MRLLARGALATALLIAACLPASAQSTINVPAPPAGPVAINIVESTAYSQDFNTLAASGTSATLPQGWAFREFRASGTGGAVDGLYAAGTGSNNAGNVYSFGASSGGNAGDRAFGTLLSGTNNPTIGAKFVNGGANPITSLTISYVGEQWRRGGTVPDALAFAWSTDAGAALDSGTWTAVASLNFGSCTAVTTVQNGDASGLPVCTTPVSATITGLSIAPGATFWIRWTDTDASPGSDDGLAIDSFTLTANGGSGNPTLSISNASDTEGNSGTKTLAFTVQLSTTRTSDTAFTINTADGAGASGATAPSDYVAIVNGAGVIPANSLSTTVSVTINGDTTIESDETFTVTLSGLPSGVDAGALTATGTILNDDSTGGACSPTHTISEVQGTGDATPFAGTQTVRGIVTARGDQGFFIQESVTNPSSLASQGIYVFTSSAPPGTAAVGNEVCVTGTVGEFSGETQISSATVSMISTSNALPAAVPLTTSNLTPNGGPNQLERYEGMLLSITGARVTAPTADFGEAAVTIPAYFRPMREPGIAVTAAGPQGNCPLTSGVNPNQPGCVPRFDANPENIVLDTDGLEGFGSRNLAAGMTFDLTAPLRFAFDTYRLLPGVLPTTLPERTPVTSVGTQNLTVATFNLENFSGGSRTALAVDNIRNFLRNPDVIGLQEVASETALNDLATQLNAANGGATSYTPVFRQSPDSARNNVFLYNAARVTQVSVTQYPADSFTFCGATDTLNDRRPLAFRGQIAGSGSVPYVFTVVNFHQRSLIGIDDQTPFNPSVCPGETTASRMWAKRAKQAEFAAQLLDTLQESGQEVIAVGDWNAFPFNDGYVDVMNTVIGAPPAASEALQSTADYNTPNFINMVSTLPQGQRYSYVFDFQAQALDQILVSGDVFARTPSFEYARVDSDFPDSIRLSDHDPGRLTIPLPNATEITGVTISRSGMLFDRRLNKWRTTFTVRNNSGQTLAAPLWLVLTSLAPSGVTVDGPAGVSDAFGATPAPYVALPAIPSGQQASVDVRFNAPAGTQISFAERVYQGAL